MKKRFIFASVSFILTIVFSVSCLLLTKLNTDSVIASIAPRNIELQERDIDYESILNEFEDATLETNGDLTTFEGYKTVDINALAEFDNLSESDISQAQESYVRYYFSYNEKTNIVTITAEMKNNLGEIEIEEISGVGFINDKNQIDAVMNIDGESILLSEMQEAGMIQNCGWFKKLVKKVVKVAVVVAAVAVVAVTTAAVVVATAGAAAPALVAAGVGVTTSAGIGAAAGVAAGALFALTVGQAAIQAGTAISEPIAEDISQVVDKATNAILEIVYKGVSYASALLTATVASNLAKDTYFMTLANPTDGAMYYCATAIDKNFAISIMAANTSVSVYTYYETNARSVAQQAGNNMSPIWERHHDYGYFDHYHLGNLSARGESHKDCHSHAFYGLPQFN
ncbi:MAG: hypothetical protein ACLRFE_01910 [Clostridia bacterium]